MKFKWKMLSSSLDGPSKKVQCQYFSRPFAKIGCLSQGHSVPVECFLIDLSFHPRRSSLKIVVKCSGHVPFYLNIYWPFNGKYTWGALCLLHSHSSHFIQCPFSPGLNKTSLNEIVEERYWYCHPVYWGAWEMNSFLIKLESSSLICLSRPNNSLHMFKLRRNLSELKLRPSLICFSRVLDFIQWIV